MGHFGGGGGGFGSSSGDAFSESGRSGTFGSSSNNDSHFNHSDPYYYNNQQMPYRGSYGGSGSGGGSPDAECTKCASIFLPFFTLFGTILNSHHFFTNHWFLWTLRGHIGPPQLCWLLNLEWLTYFEHVLQSLLNIWCLFGVCLYIRI